MRSIPGRRGWLAGTSAERSDRRSGLGPGSSRPEPLEASSSHAVRGRQEPALRLVMPLKAGAGREPLEGPPAAALPLLAPGYSAPSPGQGVQSILAALRAAA